MNSPVGRLIGRAVFVGIIAALGNLKIADTTDARALVSGAVYAGLLAAFEVFTPFNAVVGVGKQP